MNSISIALIKVPLHRQNGMSLISILIAIMISSVVLITALSLFVHIESVYKYSKFVSAAEESIREIEKEMGNTKSCTDSLINLPVQIGSKTDVPQLVASDGSGIGIISAPGLDEDEFIHKSINFQPVSRTGPLNYILRLEVFVQTKSPIPFGTPDLTRPIMVEARVLPTGEIEECSGSGLMAGAAAGGQPLAGQTCPAGSFIDGFDSVGAPTCITLAAAPAAGTPPLPIDCGLVKDGQSCTAVQGAIGPCPAIPTPFSDLAIPPLSPSSPSPYGCPIAKRVTFTCAGGVMTSSVATSGAPLPMRAAYLITPLKINYCPFYVDWDAY